MINIGTQYHGKEIINYNKWNAFDNRNKLKCWGIKTEKPILLFLHPSQKFVDSIYSVRFRD